MHSPSVLMEVSKVPTGDTIVDPVKVNGSLLCAAGTVVSEQLKKVLPKFGVTKVYVPSHIGDDLSKDSICLSNLNEETCSAIRDLDINKLILCAETLVNTTIEDCSNSLINVLLEYDKSTFIHSINVANFAVMVGINIGLSSEDLKSLAVGALLHDIGKLNVPLQILNKPNKLDTDEMAVVRQHPYNGYKLLCDSTDVNSSVKQIVWQHHENYDGSGYPRGLIGAHSYRLARLVHICDVYEALCVKRSYKQQIPRKIVRETLLQNSGRMFEPKLLNSFLDCVPMYLLGETITQGTRVGVIVDASSRDNPIVYCHGTLFTLNQFEKLGVNKCVMSYSMS